MKSTALSLAFILIFGGFATPGYASPKKKSFYNPTNHCGTERWHIKTLDDASVNSINASPISTTITQMRNLPVPAGFKKTNDVSRYAPVEKSEYTLTARLIGFKEEADRDFHVVLSEPSDATVTMIGEVPDPKCSTVIAGGHAAQIAKVRNSFIKCFGAPPAKGGYKKFSGVMTAQLTGVGFFDYVHPTPQTGVAPNAIELHPIIKVKTLSGSCPTGYSAH